MTSPSQSIPSQRSELLDLLDRLRDLAARVRVLDPQQELAALAAGEEPVEEERADTADVEEAGRARSHADADGHRAARLAACCSAPTARGGIKGALDRAAEIGADAVQLFAQSPRSVALPRARPRRTWRASASAAPRPGSAPCSCTRSTSATSRRRTRRSTARASRRCARRSTRPARSGPTASSSTSARIWAPGFEAGLERVVPALEQVLERCSDTTWLLLENSAGAGGTIGRSIDELAAIVDALDRHPRLGICLDSCHLYVSGVDVGDRTQVDRGAGGGRRADRPRPAARAARQRRGRTARLEPRPARERARG